MKTGKGRNRRPTTPRAAFKNKGWGQCRTEPMPKKKGQQPKMSAWH